MLYICQPIVQVMRGHTSSIKAVAFSPSGLYVASAALNGEVKLWSADRGVLVSYAVVKHCSTFVLVLVLVVSKLLVTRKQESNCFVRCVGGFTVRPCSVC